MNDITGSTHPRAMRSFALVAALLLLGTPSALATWSFHGGYEPSTPYDTPGWMFADPVSAPSRVYFNVVSLVGTTGYGGGLANPNVALLRTQFEPFVMEMHEAMLGVWVDCNGDGYVGAIEGALREYPASLLLDDSSCPAVTGPANQWTPGAHNYNKWVSEYVPIANDELLATDKRAYRDVDAMVWGDRGKPGERRGCGGDHADPTLALTECLARTLDANLPGGMGNVLPHVEGPGPKRSADWNFRFYTATRGAFPLSLFAPGTAGADASAGLFHEGSRWAAESFTVKPLPKTVSGSVDRPFGDPAWYTFYARVGHGSTRGGAALPGSTSVYGAAECGDDVNGVLRNWDCDPDRWYRYPDGTPHPEGRRTLARPGHLYHLRDVDCYDGSSSTLAFGVSPSFYGDAPCW